MKFIHIVPALIIALTFAWTFKLKGETKVFNSSVKAQKQETDHSHDEEEGEDHSHGEEKGDEHGHDEEKGDEHGHGEEKGDEHGHGEEEGKEDEHGHGGGEKVGADKAITEVNEKKGFKLSKEAFNTLDVKLQEVGSGQILISKSTLATSKNKTGVYRYREGYFKFISVTIKRRDKTGYLIEAKDLQSGDQIVTGGVGLIAITDVYSTDTAEYGHGH